MAKGLVILMEKNLSTKNQCSPNYLRSSAGSLYFSLFWLKMTISEIDQKYFLRLESFYSNKYGADNLIIITDSKQVIAGSTFCLKRRMNEMLQI